MKNSGQCPKCQSKDILRIQGRRMGPEGYNNIPTGVFSVAIVDRYVCGQCGYLEEWLVSPKDIDKLRGNCD